MEEAENGRASHSVELGWTRGDWMHADGSSKTTRRGRFVLDGEECKRTVEMGQFRGPSQNSWGGPTIVWEISEFAAGG